MMVHLYADANGVSHFKDLEVTPQMPPQKAAAVTFSRVPAGTDRGMITPPNRHYVFFMAGQTEIGAGDSKPHVIRSHLQAGVNGLARRIFPSLEKLDLRNIKVRYR